MRLFSPFLIACFSWSKKRRNFSQHTLALKGGQRSNRLTVLHFQHKIVVCSSHDTQPSSSVWHVLNSLEAFFRITNSSGTGTAGCESACRARSAASCAESNPSDICCWSYIAFVSFRTGTLGCESTSFARSAASSTQGSHTHGIAG